MASLNPDLSIIIVNFNTKQLLYECLDSIQSKVKEITYEVFVVDNASIDGSAEMVEREFPWVKLIKNKENLGFAKANNQAIGKAKGEIILLLNSDTLIIDNNIKPLLTFMKNHKNVGIVGCKVLDENGNLSYTAINFPDLISEWWFFSYDIIRRILNVSFYKKYKGINYDKISPVDWVSGCAFFIKKEVIKKIGMLDENFFLYYEDTEYCYRAKKAGFEVIYYPFYKILHYRGKSGDPINFKTLIYCFNSSCYYFQKTHGYLYAKIFKTMCKINWLVNISFLLSFGLTTKHPKIFKKLNMFKTLFKYT